MHTLAVGHGRENEPFAGNIISLLVLRGRLTAVIGCS